MSCHYNYYVITAELMRRSELHDDLLNNRLVFLQLAVNGKTDNIFLMVSLRVCATAGWWSYGITQYKMASNIQLTTGRDREIAGLILQFR